MRALGLLQHEEEHAKRNGALRTVDVMYTYGRPVCCIATSLGFRYGMSHAHKLCAYHHRARHKAYFVDCNWRNYSHAQHVELVKRMRPKYCTVVDLLTPEQAREVGAKAYELKQVLEFAEELKQYAQHVIVIPKYDCLDAIPDEYILGYSLASSYGVTPMPIEAFRGRRVHLLGGTLERITDAVERLGSDVISFDINYLSKLAVRGRVWCGPRKTCALREFTTSRFGVFYVCVTLSLTHAAHYLDELFAGKWNADHPVKGGKRRARSNHQPVCLNGHCEQHHIA
ncbi:MAG: hypothetical protein N2545_05110 [Thermoflexales bacterium]|nr:hypothetical protein [Thermoflexales bacterium]